MQGVVAPATFCVAWRMAGDYRMFNQMVPPKAAAVPAVASQPEQFPVPSGTQQAAIGLAHVFFSIPVHQAHSRCSSFSAGRPAMPLPCPASGVSQLSSLSSRGLDSLSLPQDITLAHYVDDILLTEPGEKEAVTYHSRFM